MFNSKTILDQREIRRDGTVLLRFAKVVMNGDTVLSSSWHRASLAPGADVVSVLDQVSANLVDMGFPVISVEDVTAIKATCEKEWTPEVLAAYAAAVAAQENSRAPEAK